MSEEDPNNPLRPDTIPVFVQGLGKNGSRTRLGFVAQGFGSDSTPSSLALDITRKLNEFGLVLYIVPGVPRMHDVAEYFRRHSTFAVVSPYTPFDALQSGTGHIYITSSLAVLTGLSSFQLPAFDAIVYDQAQAAHDEEHPIVQIYKKLGKCSAVPVAMITEPTSELRVREVMKSLNVRFPYPELPSYCLLPKSSVRTHVYEVETRPPDTQRPVTPMNILNDLLGNSSVVLYLQWFTHSEMEYLDPMIARWLSRKSNITMAIVMNQFLIYGRDAMTVIFTPTPETAIAHKQMIKLSVGMFGFLTCIYFGKQFVLKSAMENDERTRTMNDDLFGDKEKIGRAQVVIVVAERSAEFIGEFGRWNDVRVAIDLCSKSGYTEDEQNLLTSERVLDLVVFKDVDMDAKRLKRKIRNERRRSRVEAHGEERGTRTMASSRSRLNRKSRDKNDNDILPTIWQEVPEALVGPTGSEMHECYLYRIVLPGFTEAVKSSTSQASWPTTTFGVILTKQLKKTDCEVSLKEVGVYDCNAKPFHLELIGKVHLDEKKRKVIREYVKQLFGFLDLLVPPRFTWNWGERIPSTGDEGLAGGDPKYLYNYLVVPLCKQTAAESSSSGKYPLDSIDFDSVRGLLSNHTYKSTPDTGPVEDYEIHEGTMILSSNPKRRYPLLAGNLRKDKFVTDEIEYSHSFKLNKAKGSLKPDPYLELLTNVYQVEDPTGLAPLVEGWPTVKPEKEKWFKFEPARNREEGRDKWHAMIKVDYRKRTTEIWEQKKVKDLEQNMLVAIDPPTLNIEHLQQVLQGTPLCKVLCDVANEIIEKKQEKTHADYVVPEVTKRYPVLTSDALLLPSILAVLERHLSLCELREYLAPHKESTLNLDLLADAVTPKHINWERNYERLEFLGDGLLEILASERAFSDKPHEGERACHEHREKLVTNDSLKQAAGKTRIIHYLNTVKDPVLEWEPPGTHRVGRALVELKRKILADMVESLAGATYLSTLRNEEGRGDERQLGACQVTDDILQGLNVFKDKRPTRDQLLLSAMQTFHGKEVEVSSVRDFPVDARVKEDWKATIEPVQEILGYRFEHLELLLVACSHRSYSETIGMKGHSLGFERLEFLGDAVVGFLISEMLVGMHPNSDPELLTNMKGECVSNETFARIVVESGLVNHFYISCERTKTNRDLFIKAMLKEQEGGTGKVDRVKVPKQLSDMLEALIGAAFIDGGLLAAKRVTEKLCARVVAKMDDPKNVKIPAETRFKQYIEGELEMPGALIYPEFVTGKNGLFYCEMMVEGIRVVKGKLCANKKGATKVAYEIGLKRLKLGGYRVEAKIQSIRDCYDKRKKTLQG